MNQITVTAILRFFFNGTCIFSDEDSMRLCKIFRSTWTIGFLSLLSGILFSSFQFGFFHHETLWLVGSTLVFIVSPLSIIYLHKIKLFMRIFHFLTSAMVLGSIFMSGGIYSPRAIWLLIIFQSAMMLLNYKEAFIFLSVSTFLLFARDLLFTNNFYHFEASHFQSDLYIINISLYFLTTLAFHYVLYKNKRIAHTLYSKSNTDDQLKYMLHELRAPVSTLYSLLKRLNATTTDSSVENKQLMSQIDSLSEHLKSILLPNEFSTNAKSNILNKSEKVFSVSDLINKVISNSSFIYKNSSIRIITTIDSDVPAYVAGPKPQIKQILINLLTNAIKFSENNSKIFINIKTLAKSNEYVNLEFSIRDMGRGIPHSKLKDIFSPYKQVEAQDAKTGTGIGLTICKQLADDIQSDLQVKSQLNVGSEFTLTIQLKNIDEQEVRNHNQSIRKPISFSSIPKLNALVVDDDSISLMSYLHIISDLGWNVITVTNTKDALNILNNPNSDINCLIIDQMLSGESGMDFISECKASHSFNPFLPIFLITADYSEDLGDKVKFAGADGLLHKPLDPIELATYVDFSKAKITTCDHYNELISRFNDKDHLAQLLEMYMSSYKERLSALSDAIRSHDISTIKSEAHKFKGTLLNFGGHSAIGTVSKIQKADSISPQEQEQLLEDLLSDTEKFNVQIYKISNALKNAA